MHRPLVPLVGTLAVFLLFAASRGDASEPCRIAKGDSPVAKACAEGGVPRARESMRQLLKKARDAGTRFQCDDCHSDDERFDRLAPEAKQNFVKLLAAAAKG